MKLLVALLLAASVYAQTANVIELQPADSSRAQQAWNALQKAQGDWDAVRKEIESQYVRTGPVWASGPDGPIKSSLAGFENGFEFSKDFRFVVPKTAEPAKTPSFQWYSSPTLQLNSLTKTCCDQATCICDSVVK